MPRCVRRRASVTCFGVHVDGRHPDALLLWKPDSGTSEVSARTRVNWHKSRSYGERVYGKTVPVSDDLAQPPTDVRSTRFCSLSIGLAGSIGLPLFDPCDRTARDNGFFSPPNTSWAASLKLAQANSIFQCGCVIVFAVRQLALVVRTTPVHSP